MIPGPNESDDGVQSSANAVAPSSQGRSDCALALGPFQFGAIATPKINTARLIADLRTAPRLPNSSLSALPEIPPHRWLSLDSFSSSFPPIILESCIFFTRFYFFAWSSGRRIPKADPVFSNFFLFFYFICRSLACDFLFRYPHQIPRLVPSLFIFAPISPILCDFSFFDFLLRSHAHAFIRDHPRHAWTPRATVTSFRCLSSVGEEV